MTNFTMTSGSDGVATILFDVQSRSMNVLSRAAWLELSDLVDQAKADAAVRGILIMSAKANAFCAGADLDELMSDAGTGPAGSQAAQDAIVDRWMLGNHVAREIETCGKPVAAVISGLALGGGLELALACHYRVVADNPKIKLGLPEAGIGLLPGGGGTQRTARLLGIAKAMPLLLEGKTLSPRTALDIGLVDAVVPGGGEEQVARSWLLGTSADAKARWDEPDFVVPGLQGDARAEAGVAASRIANFPAIANIVRAVNEGVRLPVDEAIRLETRYFVETLQSPQAKAMIRTLFQSQPSLRKGSHRPAGPAVSDVTKVAVLGAGMMGAGIAYAIAAAGIETILVDVSQDAAERGKAYSEKVLAKLVQKGITTQDRADAHLSRITPTNDVAKIAGSDFVIETVFEDVEVKADVTRRAIAYLGDDVIFASNTSTLPINLLAQAHPEAARFIGMHFHSPVDRMELVEVVIGNQTDGSTVARTLDLVKQIGKTAILAHDSPFFYTSRVFDTYIREGMEMLVDGFAPDLIDEVGRSTGMPRGPLEMSDDVAIDLLDRIANQRRALLGVKADRRRSDDVVDMLMNAGRQGRKNGAGFYDYREDGSKETWSGLAETWPVKFGDGDEGTRETLRRRLLHRQAVEAARCLAEGVLDDPRYADVGAIWGWSFPRWTGGPISYIDQIGTARFVAEADRLTQDWGTRFGVPPALREKAKHGEPYYEPQAARGQI